VKKILLEIIQLIKRIFNLPKNYMIVQNENTVLKKDNNDAIKYIEKLELLVQNIGHDLSKFSLFLENKTDDEKKDDILKFEILAIGLKESLKQDFLEFEKKSSDAEFIEKALYQLLRNYSDKDNELIEKAIQYIKRRGFMK
jgi:hypothetical protein